MAVASDDEKNPAEIWSFRGYGLSPGEFNTAMVHFYRGELTRSNTWRTRIDGTTNWAVLTTGAALSFAFGSASNSHLMIPLNTLLVLLFLFIETRRYRYYELWSYRLRLLETDFFGAMLAPPFQPSENWAPRLVNSLLHPDFTISFWEAFGRRFRRNYQFLFAILALAWLAKVLIHPTLALTLSDFLENASIGPLPGSLILLTGLILNGLLFAVGWLTYGLHDSKGEVIHENRLRSLFQSASEAIVSSHWPGQREQLAHIIIKESKAELISERLMTMLGRGVTAVAGKGMYSGEARTILFVAIEPNQALHLKNLVRDLDPEAFVIIHRADEVIGRGFHAPS